MSCHSNIQSKSLRISGMAIGAPFSRCCMCKKNEAKCNCKGCKQLFCVKHFQEHRQQLSIQFDNDVVRAHNKLFVQINQMKQLNRLSDNLFSQFESLTTEIRRRREEDDFVEDTLIDLQQQINQLTKFLKQLIEPNTNEKILLQTDWNQFISAQKQSQTKRKNGFNTTPLATWTQQGITVAGGHGQGNGINQLFGPHGLYVDDDRNVLVADYYNNRIVEWKCDAISGQVLVGGEGRSSRIDQLGFPSDVIVDKQTNCLIICDSGRHRVVQWPRHDGTNAPAVTPYVFAIGLTIDDDGFIYVSCDRFHNVKRWRVGDTQKTLVAGGNDAGYHLNQLNSPAFVYLDGDHSLYVSDCYNHRVMKWMKGAKEGIIVAGGLGQGNALTQLSYPQGVIVDQLGAVYVADSSNDRVMRWYKGAKQGCVVVGGNGRGTKANQLYCPSGLSFDRDGNLYVADCGNDRVQKFSINIQC